MHLLLRSLRDTWTLGWRILQLRVRRKVWWPCQWWILLLESTQPPSPSETPTLVFSNILITFPGGSENLSKASPGTSQWLCVLCDVSAMTKRNVNQCQPFVLLLQSWPIRTPFNMLLLLSDCETVHVLDSATTLMLRFFTISTIIVLTFWST